MKQPVLVSVTVALILSMTGSFACAHELKVLASNLAVAEPNAKVTIYLSWGHRLPVDDLVDAATLERFTLVAPDGKETLLKAADVSLQANVVELKQSGVHQVLACRKPSTFTYVIDEQGEKQLKRGPKTAATGGKIDSATRSMQCAKALLVVGNPGAEPVQAVGLPIEITPVDPPAAWKEGASLRFRVLVEGKPSAYAEVLARPIGFKPDNAWCYATTANKQGEAVIHLTRAGTWVLKVNVKRLTHGNVREQYDFESFTATLAFEVLP